MNTTTQITSNAAAYLTGDLNATLTLDGYVGQYAADFDMNAVNAAYLAEIEETLAAYRPDWTISGDCIFGGYPADHLTDEERAEIGEAISMIDVAAILEANAN